MYPLLLERNSVCRIRYLLLYVKVTLKTLN
nr:MAG TPA: hypothetical protein [Caudoviricetes sp.]